MRSYGITAQEQAQKYCEECRRNRLHVANPPEDYSKLVGFLIMLTLLTCCVLSPITIPMSIYYSIPGPVLFRCQHCGSINE